MDFPKETLSIEIYLCISMELQPLTAITPLDSRYRKQTEPLRNYFSGSLMKYRVFVEIEYFIALCELPLATLNWISGSDNKETDPDQDNFNLEDAKK